MQKGYACPVCHQVAWGEGIINQANPHVSCECCGWHGEVDELLPVMILSNNWAGYQYPNDTAAAGGTNRQFNIWR
jgi:hypothetical protein